MKTAEQTTITAALEKAQYNVPQAMKEFFLQAEVQAQEWADKASAIQVADSNDVGAMQLARATRLELRGIRLGVAKKHEELKADALHTSQTLDLIKRTLLGFIEPIEASLQEKEDFAVIQESNRKLELYKKRIEVLKPYRTPNDMLEQLPLGEMVDDAFIALYSGLKAAHEHRESVEQEKQQREKFERDRMANENKALHRYNDRVLDLTNLGFKWIEETTGFHHAGIEWGIFKEKIQKMAVEEWEHLMGDLDYKVIEYSKQQLHEKQQLEAKLKKEREQRMALEKEQREREAKAEADKKEKAAAERKAKRAPDKEKLLTFADAIGALAVPAPLKDDEAMKIRENAIELLTKVVTYIRTNAEKL